MEFVFLALSSLLLGNIVFTRLLGIENAFNGETKLKKTLINAGILVVIALFSGLINYGLYLLLNLLNLGSLILIIFTTVTSLITVLVEFLIKKFLPKIHSEVAGEIKLIGISAVIIVITLDIVGATGMTYDFAHVLVYLLFSSLGYGLIMILFALINDRLKAATNAPAPFIGAAQILISLALVAMTIAGFNGVF